MKLVRGVGWSLVIAGAVVLLYVVYLLWFTNFETDRAQRDLAETWALTVPDADLPVDGASRPDGADGADTSGGPGAPDTSNEPSEPEPADASEPSRGADDALQSIALGDAYAAVWFERNGELIVSDEVLYVVEGVSLDVLRAGPGHYPESDRPGGAGNLAIAGHRTTYGSPFWSMDALEEGDSIHVVDRDGREWIYAYREQRVVDPGDVWVVGDDPLGAGAPTLTLTTCHPRGSARQRLIAWGELVGDPIESTAGDAVGALAGT